MKHFITITGIALLLVGKAAGLAQGFVNLDFESTTLATNGAPGTVSTAIGLPGWNAFIGGVSQSTILYNNTTLGVSCVAIHGRNSSSQNIIQGNFYAELLAGSTGDAAISQIGLVPANARTILFEAFAMGGGLPNLAVTLNGQPISILPVQTTPNYPTTLFEGDISSFAGQAANLTFTAASNYPVGLEYFGLDAISFSSTPVPEPGELALAALGMVLLGFRSRRNL